MTGLPWDLEFELEPCGLDLASMYDRAAHRLDFTVINNGSEPVTPGRVHLRAGLDAPAVSGYAWLHGRSSGSDALVHAFGDEPPEYDGPGRYEALDDGTQRYQGEDYLGFVIPVRQPPALFIGALQGDRFLVDFTLDLGEGEIELTALRVTVDFEATTIEPGGALTLPSLWIREGADLNALAAGYAGAVAPGMHARVPAHIPTGWSSRYVFGDRVTEADVVANLHELQVSGLPVEYVDAGTYADRPGDWLQAASRFPSGMAALAAQIGDAGYRPGLCIEPFLLHEDSQALRDHPEMALTTHSGDRVMVETGRGPSAVLDCSHPGAQGWLSEVVTTITAEWGYQYLELDSLRHAAQSSVEVVYHDPSFTAPANLRRGLEIIREAAGRQVFLQGGDSLFLPAVGTVEGMRTGPDIAAGEEAGEAMRLAMELTLQRNFMHMRWWANDAGGLLVGEDSGLSLAEIRFMLAAAALSGGMVFVGDDLRRMSTGRRAIAEVVLPPARVAAEPEDPGDGPVPFAFRAPLGDGRALVGVLNWSDEDEWVHADEHLDAGELAFDVFRGEVLGKGDLHLGPFDATLWQVSAPGPEPHVFGDTGHIQFARLYQRPVSGRIQVGNDLHRPRVVAVDVRGRAHPVVLQPGERRWFD